MRSVSNKNFSLIKFNNFLGNDVLMYRVKYKYVSYWCHTVALNTGTLKFVHRNCNGQTYFYKGFFCNLHLALIEIDVHKLK